MKKLNVAVLALAVAGAGLGAQAGDLNRGLVADRALIERAASLPVYAEAGGPAPPKVLKDLGYVSAAVCTFQDNDVVGHAAVLNQLRARAALEGADAIVHVRLVANTNLRSSCWRRGFTASGEAVSFR